jgi:hypothetical protein
MVDLGFLGNDFDATTEKEISFEPIPAGEYKAIAENSEMKTSQGGDDYLSVKFVILEGQYKGRKIFNNFNLRHSKANVAEIARAEFAAFCRACNKPKPTDTASLHNVPIMLKVGVSKRKDTGDLQNSVKGYSRLGGGQQPTPGGSPQSSAPWSPQG